MTTEKTYRVWTPGGNIVATRISVGAADGRRDAARVFAVLHFEPDGIRHGHDSTRTVAVSDENGAGVQVFDVTVSIAVAEAVTS